MNFLALIGPLGTMEVIIIALVVLLFFGGKKLPELMKGVGKGIKSFKDGVSGIEDEIKDAVNTHPGTNKDKADSKSDTSQEEK